MKTLARIASALIAASLTVLPLTAMAEQSPAEAKSVDAKGHKGSSQRDKPAFPMKADEFRKMVAKRIEQIKAHVERSMTKHSLPAPARTEVGKHVDAAVKEIHVAVDKAAADGVVTRDEAKQVKDVARQLREKMREQLKEKGPRAKATKGKGKAKPKSA